MPQSVSSKDIWETKKMYDISFTLLAISRLWVQYQGHGFDAKVKVKS